MKPRQVNRLVFQFISGLILIFFLIFIYIKTRPPNIFPSEINEVLNENELRSVLLAEGTKDRRYEYEVLGLLSKNNQARMSPAVDNITSELLKNDDFGFFHVVTTFVPFSHPGVRKDLLIGDGGAPSDLEIEARMSEVIDCLQRNLEHKSVAYVHVLVVLEESISYLRMINIRSSYKLIIHKNQNSPKTKDLIAYAAEYLQNKSVIVTHQDNYMGAGWEMVNHHKLRKQRLMYALTRHHSTSNCKGTTLFAHCGPGYPYLGSHDTFVFFLSDEFRDPQLINEFDFTPNLYGIENIIIWIFQTKLKYKVVNPCKVLIMYHNHCIAIREKNRPRINPKGKSGTAGFTDQLE